MSPRTRKRPSKTASALVCPECGRSFTRAAALGSHRSRVHGVADLYVTGSSVFPTSGFANPTLTIVALALRLADHLRGRLSAG